MNQVITVDCQYVQPQFAAAFLLLSRQGNDQRGEKIAAIVETNTSRAAPRILDELHRQGFSPEHVRYVIVTHAHLDHSGGAYALMKACPNATLLAHPKTVPHLVDPSKLIAGVRQVYGDEVFDKLYGKIEPIDSARVRAMQDGEKLRLEFSDGTLAREWEFLDTRGHAPHHICIYDSGSEGIFTGDSFGLAYPALQKKGLFVFPSTSPTGFDPAEALKTIDRILATGAKKAFLTHFGEVSDLQGAAAQLRADLRFCENLLDEAVQSGLDDAAVEKICLERIQAYYSNRIKNAGWEADSGTWNLLKLDLELNAAGIAFVAKRKKGVKA